MPARARRHFLQPLNTPFKYRYRQVFTSAIIVSITLKVKQFEKVDFATSKKIEKIFKKPIDKRDFDVIMKVQKERNFQKMLARNIIEVFQ
ncbi:MAG: hypothetical protein J1G07_06730 [Clostridiales bacterium]|nr:hypothetical protein [Clostridiales bacterium]